MPPHRVVCVVPEDVRVLDVAAPAHFFGHLGAPHYRFELAAELPGPVRCSSAFELIVPNGLAALRRADTVVVPGYGGNEVAPPEPLLRALRAASARGARVMSICTGAFALAHAGLLDGRSATTHWRDADLLAQQFPQVDVRPGVLYVDEGDVLTSAGVAAGLDLCLHVVRRDLGEETAAAFARRAVVAPHRDGGQAQFIDLPIPGTDRHGAGLEATRAWALEHLGEPLDVAALAAHAHVSPRTFARRFRAETGTTPHRWVQHQRVLAARRLLESTELPVEEVAARAGFGSAASLRAHFREHTATSPTAYRQAFAGPA